jgi:hypothetical protein
MTVDPKRLAIGAAKAMARAAVMPVEAIQRHIRERRPREQPWDENA